MKTSSCKAKGRRLQQLVRDDLRSLSKEQGLVDDDINSTGMGQSGVDILLSPAAKKVWPLSIECKNVEKLNVVGVFQKHYKLYEQDGQMKLLIHSRNNTRPMVTLRWDDMLQLLVKNFCLARIVREKLYGPPEEAK